LDPFKEDQPSLSAKVGSNNTVNNEGGREGRTNIWSVKGGIIGASGSDGMEVKVEVRRKI